MKRCVLATGGSEFLGCFVVRDLLTSDASLLPRSMGNPPILTIMALAKRVARLAAEHAR